MTGQSTSKGNGASKRMSNPNRAAKRQRSWTRGQAKKKRNEAINNERMKTNELSLAMIGGTRQTYERVTERRVTDNKGNTTVKTFTRTKLESPGTALARTRREQR